MQSYFFFYSAFRTQVGFFSGVDTRSKFAYTFTFNLLTNLVTQHTSKKSQEKFYKDFF